MNTEKLEEIYKKLSEFLAADKEEEAREYLGTHLSELPEATRNEVMFEMFVDAIQNEARERETIAQIQEQAVTAAEALEEAKTKSQEKG